MRDAAVPAAHGEGEVARVALGGPRQEAALVAALLQQRLGLDAVDVGVEPTSGGHFYPASPAVKGTYNTLWSVV